MESHYSAIPVDWSPSGLNVAYWPCCGKLARSLLTLIPYWSFPFDSSISVLTHLFSGEPYYSSVMSPHWLFRCFELIFYGHRFGQKVSMSEQMWRCTSPKESSAGTWGRFPTAATVFLFLITFLFQQAALNGNNLRVFYKYVMYILCKLLYISTDLCNVMLKAYPDRICSET